MKLENEEPKLEISDSDCDFAVWSKKDFVPEKYRESIRNADILIVPQISHLNYEYPTFPQATIELFNKLKKDLNKCKVELCWGDNEYKEIALYGIIFSIGQFIISSVVVPLFVSYIYDVIKDRIKKERDSKVEVRFKMNIIEGNIKKQISYSGPAKEFESMLNKGLKQIQPEYKNNLLQHQEDKNDK